METTSPRTSERRGADAPTHSGDATCLAALRDLAAREPEAARDLGWAWLDELRSAEDRARLAWLFAQGVAPDAPDGDCEGMVLGLHGALWLDAVDRLVRAGRLLGGIGWTGKSFDRASGTGYNRLTRSSRLPMGMAMPTYRFATEGRELVGFRFDHQRDRSPLAPHPEVLSIAYARPAYRNPLVLPDTRDELVELVPKLYLGRALHRDERGFRVVGYFVLRHPAPEGRRRAC